MTTTPDAPSLAGLLRAASLDSPDQPALVDGGRSVSYGWLAGQAARVRDRLPPNLADAPFVAVRAAGLVDLVVVEVALQALGLDVLLIDQWSKPADLVASLAALGDPPLVATRPVEGAPSAVVVEVDGAASPPPEDLEAPSAGGRVAVQSPRAAGGAVVLARDSIVDDARAFVDLVGLPAGGTWLNCVPPTSVHGQQALAASWLVRGSLAWQRFDADTFWDTAGRVGAAAVSLLGSMATSVARPGMAAPTVVKAALGGSFIEDPTQAFEAVTGVRLVTTFGSPFVGLVAAAGHPIPGVSVRIAVAGGDDAGPIEVAKSARAVGVLGAGGHVEPIPTSADGYVRLVEHGRLDDEGQLHVTAWPGTIKRSGDSIAHATILGRLGDLTSRAQVELLDDGHDGEWQRYVLRVVGEGIDEDLVAAACARLPRPMRPDAIDVRTREG